MKRFSNVESAWAGLALVIIGMLSFTVSGIASELVPDRVVGSVVGVVLIAASAGTVVWGAILMGRKRCTFQVDEGRLTVVRRTLRRHEIIHCPIDGIHRIGKEGNRVVIEMTGGETVETRGPFSESSEQALSVVCSMLASRQHEEGIR